MKDEGFMMSPRASVMSQQQRHRLGLPAEVMSQALRWFSEPALAKLGLGLAWLALVQRAPMKSRVWGMWPAPKCLPNQNLPVWVVRHWPGGTAWAQRGEVEARIRIEVAIILIMVSTKCSYVSAIVLSVLGVLLFYFSIL